MIAGLDLGDTTSVLHALDAQTGEPAEVSKIRTTPDALAQHFRGRDPMRIALEVGTHSPWVSRLLERCGHEVIVANARKVRLVYADRTKSDALDAEKLARLARFDPQLLAPVRHRGAQRQAHLAVLRARDALVHSRTALVNHVRGAAKAFGCRLPKADTSAFHKKAAAGLPDALRPALMPLVQVIATLSEQIKVLDKRVAALAEEQYPATRLLTQIRGVGPVTALTFVLTLGDPARFASGRSVGAYLGLTPGRRQSGGSDPRQRISKQGDGVLRRLLVQSAQYLLGPFGTDCDLRRYGEAIAARGGAYARQRAIVAVARKLAALMHHLWVAGEVYDPWINRKRAGRTQPAG